MKVLTFGKGASDLETLLKQSGFEIVKENPQVIISYGGDGTLLFAEREYPGIPKLPIRNSKVCKKCSNHEDKTVLKKLLEDELKIKEYKKLHTNVYGKDIYALNDFVVRNDLPTHAIRFKLSTIIESMYEFFIGDGIVVSTAFGSTGYFKSITNKPFNKDSADFSIALNNTTEKVDPIYVWGDEDDQEAWFQLVRGKAILSVDNDPEVFHLSEGTNLTFNLSDQVARIYEDTSLRCPNCEVIRG